MIVWNWNISLSDKGGQLQKAPEQALLVYHKFSLKSTLHNRGHILAAAQVVWCSMVTLGILTSTLKTHTNTFLQMSYEHEKTIYKMGSAKEEGQLSIHLPKI